MKIEDQEIVDFDVPNDVTLGEKIHEIIQYYERENTYSKFFVQQVIKRELKGLYTMILNKVEK